MLTPINRNSSHRLPSHNTQNIEFPNKPTMVPFPSHNKRHIRSKQNTDFISRYGSLRHQAHEAIRRDKETTTHIHEIRITRDLKYRAWVKVGPKLVRFTVGRRLDTFLSLLTGDDKIPEVASRVFQTGNSFVEELIVSCGVRG